MITIVDTGLGNIAAVKNMLSFLGFESQITADPIQLLNSQKVILPGVGAFDSGIESLASKGLIKPLRDIALAGEAKLLGICLGMQLMFEGSDEGNSKGLCLLKGDFKRIQAEYKLKVPHMRWNRLSFNGDLSLFENVENNNRFYFIHSYILPGHHVSQFDEVGLCAYGTNFVAAFRKGNLMGTQFHPEKSHKFGLKLLENFGRM